MAENVDYAPFETTTAGPAEHSATQPVSAEELSRLHDVPVELAVEVGRTKITIREALPLGLRVTEVLEPSGSESADGAEGDA